MPRLLPLLLLLLLSASLLLSHHGVQSRRLRSGQRNRNRNLNRKARRGSYSDSVEVQDVPDPVTYDAEVVTQHSLVKPLTEAVRASHWTLGGHTVVTKDFVRLTGDVQDSVGWLWNDVEMNSKNWEVEVMFKIYSEPHFGGEGFAIWLLHQSMDPVFAIEKKTELNGDVFGMRKDFKGFGVVLDVYDNDNNRNNPQVFTIVNNIGNDNQNSEKWDHDDDYRDSAFRVMPDPARMVGHSVTASQKRTYRSNKCVMDVRNTGNNGHLLLKFIDNILHVYTKTQNTQSASFRFCLAVELPVDEYGTFENYHLALTARTAQVADAHEVVQLTTRYLDDDERQFDDTLLDASDTYAADTWGDIGRRVFAWLHAGVFGLAVFMVTKLYTLSVKEKIDSTIVCNQVNVFVVPYYVAQWVVCVLMLLAWHWFWTFLLHLSISVWHAYRVHKKQHRVQAFQLDSSKIHMEGWKGKIRKGLFQGLPWEFCVEIVVLSFISIAVIPYML